MSRMKHFSRLIKPKGSAPSNGDELAQAAPNSPQARVRESIRLFCENENVVDDDGVRFLPAIVEAAEASDAAATAAAHQLRTYLSKDYAAKPAVQYNSVMLVRILSDNPGPRFTKNFDAAFVKAVKDVLRTSKNHGTQQILRETLDSMEVNKMQDEGLRSLLHMWRKEKGQGASLSDSRRPSAAMRGQHRGRGAVDPYGSNSTPGTLYEATTLPPPHELAGRVEEARNTAKLLLQFVQTTPTENVLSDDMMREFGERCQAAQRSMQQYINCRYPEPDHETMQTLIEANEQLSLAGSRYQRALLAARRAMGMSPSPNSQMQSTQAPTTTAFGSPPSQQLQSAFSIPPTQPMLQTDGYGNRQSFQSNGYQLAPAPPSGSSQVSDLAPQLPPVQQQSRFSYQAAQQSAFNPFADPVEHSRNPTHQTVEPSDRDSAYLATPIQASQPSPHHSPQSGHESRYVISPQASPEFTSQQLHPSQSPPRPGPGPWHTSDVTPSYIGRQASAMNGLTMHGAQVDTEVQEIDGHSQIGRKDRNQPTSSAFGISR